MKIYSFIFLIFWGFTTSAQTLSVYGKPELSQSKPISRVNIYLKNPLQINKLNDSIILAKVPLQKRPKIVLGRLKSNADQIQHKLLSDIFDFEEKNPGSYSDIRQFFIVNMISLNASEGLIKFLSQSEFIEKIENAEDIKIVYRPPASISSASIRQSGGHEPGLSAIKAPFLWKKGYTGKGRRVYVIDTGVWPDHPAIRRQWRGNYFPLASCWKSFDRLEPGDKSSSHGTHVTGTCLGLDADKADTIGVAFNATYMVADPIVQNLNLVKPIEELIGAFEFALNPDGDTNTIDDIPDVVNNSWGIAASDSSLCESQLVGDMFSALDAAGIAVEFSAGNEGPELGTISRPQYVSIDTLNIFTVGAVIANEDGRTPSIADFSSRGPGPCNDADDLDPLKIKPEVCAPGYSVRSCVGQNQYAYYSGTSMAGPHVSGAVLLLKEAFPYLSGRELLNALYQTATDLGIPGEDNDYGRGLINLEEAFNFLSKNNLPVIPDSSLSDFAIERIIYPSALCRGSKTIGIIISNKGKTQSLSGKIYLRKNQALIGKIDVNTNLLPGTMDTVSFENLNFSELNQELYAKLETDTTIREQDYLNNNSSIRFRFTDSQMAPYFQDFENVNLLKSREIINNPDYYISWDTISTAGLEKSRLSAFIRFLGYVPRQKQKDELILPEIFIPPGIEKLTLSFDYGYRYRKGYEDSVQVFLSNDCGQNWSHLLFSKGGKTLETKDTSWVQFVPLKPNHWMSEVISLDSFIQNGSILIKFCSINDGGSRFYLDNVNVFADDINAINKDSENSNLPNFSVFPNPASNHIQVVLENMGANIDHVILSDVFGRKSLETKWPSGANSINLSWDFLSAGIYNISIQSERNYYSKRIIIHR